MQIVKKKTKFKSKFITKNGSTFINKFVYLHFVCFDKTRADYNVVKYLE